MVVAGIDEAGYGPLLGPLVVGCCAFELSGVANGADGGAEPPCLWKRLRKLVSRNRTKGARKLHINDSKIVYNPSLGVKELERSVLAVLAASRQWCGSFDELVACVADHARDELSRHRWYLPFDGERFPIEADAAAIRIVAASLRGEMERSETRCVHYAARVIPERELNRQIDATRNKASVLFSAAAAHLDHLLRTFGERGLVIVCDRQGGRGHYGALLRLMFDEWSLEIVEEIESRSEYRLSRNGHCVRLIFREKAEAQCMPVALASMLSKYLREGLMGRFNAFWQVHLPEVRPTAGYYSDGARFLQDIEQKRRELGIADAELVRCR